MPHTTIPSHCFGRAELHTLISRADQLANQSKGELSANFRAIVAAAANLDGQLADLGEEAVTRDRYARVLDPDGWGAEWLESAQVIHTAQPPVTIKVAQQMLRRSPTEYLPTGRFRLTLGAVVATVSKAELRPLMTAYLERTPGIPAGLRADLMAFVGVF